MEFAAVSLRNHLFSTPYSHTLFNFSATLRWRNQRPAKGMQVEIALKSSASVHAVQYVLMSIGSNYHTGAFEDFLAAGIVFRRPITRPLSSFSPTFS